MTKVELRGNAPADKQFLKVVQKDLVLILIHFHTEHDQETLYETSRLEELCLGNETVSVPPGIELSVLDLSLFNEAMTLICEAWTKENTIEDPLLREITGHQKMWD